MYYIYEETEENVFQYCGRQRAKLSAESFAFFRTSRTGKRHRIKYNGKRVVDYMWLRTTNGENVRVINCTYGDFKSALVNYDEL